MTTYHWDIVTEDVLQVIEDVARSIEDTAALGVDDLIQVGAIESAKLGNLQDALIEGNMHHYRRALRHDMMNTIETEWNRSNRSEGLPDPCDDEGASGYYEPTLDLSGNGGYNEEVVRTVLPALFDESYAMRLDSNPYAPEPGMPRGKGGQVSSPGHWDLIADVRIAWERAGLTPGERKAVFLTCVMEMPLRDAGEHLGTSYQTARRYTASGLGRLVNHINGVDA